MQVGDAVRLRADGRVGLVIARLSRPEPDGNPNGDFTISYRYRVLFGEKTMMIRNARSVEIINESR
jgi:hypothetical protein